MAENEDQERDRPRRPLPKGDSFYTPGAGALRREVERRSAVPLVWLHQAPTWILPLGMAVVFIAGLMAPGPLGALLLVLLALFIGWLAFLAWPTLGTGERAMRGVVVGVLAVLAVLQSGAL